MKSDESTPYRRDMTRDACVSGFEEYIGSEEGVEAFSVKKDAGTTPMKKPEVTSVAQRSTGTSG